MKKEQMIAASEFCMYHHIELAFIFDLNEVGLIEIILSNEVTYIPFKQLKQLEKLIHLKKEMNINIEGIASISHLLQRINNLQNHIVQLKNKLAFYENV